MDKNWMNSKVNNMNQNDSSSLTNANGDNQALLYQESGIGVIKGIIGAVPFAGTFINEVLFDIRSRIKQERLEDFIKTLGHKIDKIDENHISKETILSEDFSDFIESLIDKILKTKSKEKMEIFSEILASTMTSKNVDDYDKRNIYLSILANLDENEMRILEHLYRYNETAERYKNDGKILDMKAINYSEEKQMGGVSTKDFKIYFETLISKGLVFDDSFGRIGTHPRAMIKPTPLATNMIRFVKNCNEDLDNKKKTCRE